jgi:hypothetical protein
MNDGQACLTCHAQGKSAYSRAAMTIAGTLYSKATGGTGVSGATVTITPASGAPIKMVTGSSGNFYSNTAITYPATVEVSKCPDTVKMTATLTDTADCNSCHGSSMRIHLP